MSSTFRDKYGPWAVVTGASSGLGAEFARQLAEKGMHLVLVARRKDRMEELARKLEEAHHIQTKIVVADLSREDFLPGLLAELQGIDVGLLINNAGFATTGDFLDCPLDGQLMMVHLNCRAVMMLAHAFGNRLKQRGRGGMIITASTMGFGAGPGWSQYNASKGYDLLLAEALAAELKPHGVDVQALCPGGTRTEFLEVSGGTLKNLGVLGKLFFMNADDVIRTSLRRLGRSRVVVPGFINKMNVFSFRWMPRRLTTFILGRMIKAMDASHSSQ